MNPDPNMPRPRGSYTAPDASGNFPEVAEEPITPRRAEEQEFGNPLSNLFGDTTPRGSQYGNNAAKMGKYEDSFSR